MLWPLKEQEAAVAGAHEALGKLDALESVPLVHVSVPETHWLPNGTEEDWKPVTDEPLATLCPLKVQDCGVAVVCTVWVCACVVVVTDDVMHSKALTQPFEVRGCSVPVQAGGMTAGQEPAAFVVVVVFACVVFAGAAPLVSAVIWLWSDWISARSDWRRLNPELAVTLGPEED